VNGQLIKRPIVWGAALFSCIFSLSHARTNASKAQNGRQTFESICASCHGLNGKGGERAPDIATRQEVVRLSDSETMKVLRDGVLQKGMPPFASLGQTKLTEVLSYLRSLQGKDKAPMPAVNVEEAKAIFVGKGGCSQCHMVHGTGGFLGPDLSEYGASHSADDIRNAIVSAEKRPASRKGLAKARTKDGQQVSGLVRNEDNFSVQLQSLDGTFRLLQKSDINELTFDSTPLMPDNYGSSLSKTELDQLVGYLMSVADAKRDVQATRASD